MLSYLHPASHLAPAAVAWEPWSVEAYCMTATQSTDPEVRIAAGYRQFLLSRDELWTANLVEFLLGAGRRDEATAMAARTSLKAPRILLAAADARFVKALQLGEEQIAASTNLLDATQTAAYLAHISLVVDRPSPAIDVMASRYILVDPSPIPINDLVNAFNKYCAA